MRHTPRPAGAPAVPCLLLAATLALAGCSGDDATTAAPETVETTHADGTVEEVEVPEVPQTWPLTGIEVADNGSADARHPVLVTKMDNTPSSSPQMGLSHADLVVEELVEGGITRLAAFYYSDIPGAVGPVRSMRASDIGIVTPDRRLDRHQRRRQHHPEPDRRGRHHLLHRGLQGLLPRAQPLRAVQPDGQPPRRRRRPSSRR